MPRTIWPFPCCSEDVPCQVHTSWTERTIYLADPMRARLEAIAEHKGSTLREVMTAAVREYLEAPHA